MVIKNLHPEGEFRLKKPGALKTKVMKLKKMMKPKPDEVQLELKISTIPWAGTLRQTFLIGVSFVVKFVVCVEYLKPSDSPEI